MSGDQVVPDIADIIHETGAVHQTEPGVNDWEETEPRYWSRDEVRQWLCCMKLNNNLDVDVNILPMNGKGLCLIPLETFKKHIPRGGEALYRDLWRRNQCFFRHSFPGWST